MKVKRTERGWPGHFICATDCLFRRNTLLQYGKKYVVISTVGCMRRKDSQGNYGKPDSIGADRYYETMAFLSDSGDSIYHDIDVSNEIYVPDVRWAISGKELKEKESEIDNVANKMHEDYVSSVEKMLLNGEIK